MNFFSLFRYFVKEYLNGKLTREQLIEKWAYSQQVSGIKPMKFTGDRLFTRGIKCKG